MINENIEEELHEALSQWRMRHLNEPTALLLGPSEYMSVCIISARARFGRPDYIQISEWLGISIIPKVTSGIDFSVAHDHVPSLIHREEEKQTSEDRYQAHLAKLRKSK